MKGHRLAKLLGTVTFAAFVVSCGAVGCCPWAMPVPAPAPGGPLPAGEIQVVLVAQPDMVPPGGCSMLHWEVAPLGEYRVLLNGQEVPLTGEQQVCPPGTTTYELRVETPSGPQVRTVTVTVGGGPGEGPLPPTPGEGPVHPPTPGLGPPPTGGPGEECAGAPTFTYFTASPSTISAGQQVQLSWGEVRNGASGPLVASVVLSPGGFGEVGSPGSRWASPTTTTTYRLTATGCGGTATKDVTVTVGGGAPAATATPQPGGPTATQPAAAATGTSTLTRTPTPTSTTVGVLLTVIPFVPAPTSTTGSTTVALQVTNNCGRFIESVYIRLQGLSSWGSDQLGESGYMGHGEVRTFQLAQQGNYQMRAECCGGYVVSEHSAWLGPGTYDWTIIAALDIHNDTDTQIEELYIMPYPQSYWGDNYLEKEPSWPGCANYGGLPSAIVPGDSLRCFFSPGRFYLTAIDRYGKVYEASYVNLQGNSAWFVSTGFWTPPAD
jgi:hypothetical protein